MYVLTVQLAHTSLHFMAPKGPCGHAGIGERQMPELRERYGLSEA